MTKSRDLTNPAWQDRLQTRESLAPRLYVKSSATKEGEVENLYPSDFGVQSALLDTATAGTMAYNWRAAEKWRQHPLLTGNQNPRVMLPGLGFGLAAFAVYVVFDKLTGSSKAGHH